MGISARVVVKSGMKLKSSLSNNVKICSNSSCKSCGMGIPCKSRNFVYHAKCLNCPDPGEEYVGATSRPAGGGRKGGRMGEYESSIRLPQQHDRTALGRHFKEKRALENRDINQAYKFKILSKAKDPLDTFHREGLLIKKHSPAINGKMLNGFIE